MTGLVELHPSRDAAAGSALAPGAEETLAFLRCAADERDDCGVLPASPLDSPRGRELAQRAELLLGDSPEAHDDRARLAQLDPSALRELAIFMTELRLLGLSEGEYTAARDSLYQQILAGAAAGAPDRARWRRRCGARVGACLSDRTARPRAGARNARELRIGPLEWAAPSHDPMRATPQLSRLVHRARRAAGAAALALALAWAAAPAARAISTIQGPTYPVSAFVVEYALDQPAPDPDRRGARPRGRPAREPGVLTAPRPVDRTVRMRLSALPRDVVVRRDGAPAHQPASSSRPSTGAASTA